MRCPSCNCDNSADASFCEECGAKLELICPACKASVTPGARFCKKCGAATGAAAPGQPSAASTKKSNDSPIRVAETRAPENLEGERKTVTALFADIKGSTELEQDLDPEEARAIIDPALKLMIEAARRYDGYIVQSTGDGIFALFGAPVAHEDHPQRALYAALRMQEELRRYSTRLVADGGLPIEARIGANTGEVVVRSIATGGGHVEYTPIGHTTNLASRMQAVAPTGSIAVSQNTQKLVEGYFALKPLGPTKVKGLSEPVNVYEVTGLGLLRTRLQRSAGRGLTKFVGREREMEALRHAARLATDGHGQIATAVAEAGTGKSRLFFEFKATSQAGWMVLETFSVSHGKAAAYMPVIDLLQTYFKIAGHDDQRTRREKVAGKLTILDRTFEDMLPYLFALLEIGEGDDSLEGMDPRVRKRRTLDAIKRILLRESMNQPLMVIFEDLHWIDEETQALLNLLTDSIGTAKILLLVNYRPEYSHHWGNKTYYTQLRLDPLGKESADEMLTAMLGNGAQLAALKTVIIQRTGGNPFFMEETVQVLLDEGALVRNGAIKLTKPLSELRIPPTVQAILSARIDRLPADEKELLQTLAVIGKEFPLNLVRAVSVKPDDDLNRMLDNLQLAEFTYEQPAVGDIEYIFKHALTQEVAYNSVLIENRRLLHERVGGALEKLYAQQMDDHLANLAHHYGRSANIRKAIEYLHRAGAQALLRDSYPETIAYLDTALKLVSNLEDPRERLLTETQLRMALRPAHMSRLGPAAREVGELNDRLVELARESGDRGVLFDALTGAAVYHRWRAEFAKSEAVAEQLVGLAQSSGVPGRLVLAHCMTAMTLLERGQFARAGSSFSRALEAEQKVDASVRQRAIGVANTGLDAGVASRSGLGLTMWYLGFPDRALTLSESALNRADVVSRAFSVGYALLVKAWLIQLRGERGEMMKVLDHTIRHSESHEFGAIKELGELSRASAIMRSNELDPEIAHTVQLIESRDATARNNTVHLLGTLAGRCLELGGHQHARKISQLALEKAEARDDRSWQAELHRILGEAALAASAPDEAEALARFEDAIRIARLQEAKSWELRATTSLARLVAKQGNRGEAHAMLAEIYNWFTEGFDTADLKDAKALLDELKS